jgi:hypothetical protein
MHILHEPFRSPCGSGGTEPSALPSMAGLGLPEMLLNAVIGPVFALYHPNGRHGRQFWRKKSSCGVVEIAFQS